VYLPDEDVKQIIENQGRSKRTEHTITDEDELLEEL
jgi:DNA-binding IclR family transcriptional regulator